MTISFEIPGSPVPKGRARHAVQYQCKRCGRKGMRKQCWCGAGEDELRATGATLAYTPDGTAKYENLVKLVGQREMNRLSLAPLTEKLTMTAHYYFLIPESRRKKLTEGQFHQQRPDLDNCLKSVLDGLRNVAFLDDCQIVAILAYKHWSERPRAEVKLDVTA